MSTDGSRIAEGVGVDTLNAVCHEIVAVGPDVKFRKPGEHVIHLSAAADLVDFLNPNARYLWVREKHIAHAWSKGEAMEAFEKFQALSSGKP